LTTVSDKLEKRHHFSPMLVAPLWWWVGPAYRDRNDHQLLGHPVSVTQCYLTMNNTHVIRVVYTFASFSSDWMWCLCLEPHCLCTVILVSSVVLRMSLLFLNRRLPSLGRSRVENTHTHSHTHTRTHKRHHFAYYSISLYVTKQGREQKNLQRGATEKTRPKIAPLSPYLLYQYHAWKSRGGATVSPADAHVAKRLVINWSSNQTFPRSKNGMGEFYANFVNFSTQIFIWHTWVWCLVNKIHGINGYGKNGLGTYRAGLTRRGTRALSDYHKRIWTFCSKFCRKSSLSEKSESLKNTFTLRSGALNWGVLTLPNSDIW